MPNGASGLENAPQIEEVALMRHIVVVLTLSAMITGLVAGPVAAKAQVESGSIENYYMENPCTGEWILWNGTYTSVWQDIQNASGRHYSLHTNLNITGRGVDTGDTYRLLNAGNEIGNEVFIDGEYEPSASNYINVGLHTLVVSDGASPNFLITVVNRWSGDYEPQPGDISLYAERCTPELETVPTT
jgi:hypothetical protein